MWVRILTIENLTGHVYAEFIRAGRVCKLIAQRGLPPSTDQIRKEFDGKSTLERRRDKPTDEVHRKTDEGFSTGAHIRTFGVRRQRKCVFFDFP